MRREVLYVLTIAIGLLISAEYAHGLSTFGALVVFRTSFG